MDLELVEFNLDAFSHKFIINFYWCTTEPMKSLNANLKITMPIDQHSVFLDSLKQVSVDFLVES